MRIAFDLDGTLVDSIQHIHASVLPALKTLGLPEIDRPTMQSFVGCGLPNAMRELLDHVGRDQSLHQKLCQEVMIHYTSLPSDPASVYPGVIEALKTLKTLKAENHSLAICTNKPFQAALNALRDTQLLPYFDLVIGGDSLPTRKPSHEMLTACAPDLYIGDSEVDAETAQAANIPFILFTKGYRKSPIEDLPHHEAFDDWSLMPSFAAKYPRR